jgi:MoaA/NifB/PqqE/SkfB family radical SAM enzyme
MRPDPNYPESKAYIGNVLEQTFDEVWFGEDAESIRRCTLEGRLHNKCRCPGCPFSVIKPPYKKKEFEYNEYPTSLEIDLPNTHCNVGGLHPDPVKSPACIMCERSSPHFRPEQNHLFEVLDRIKHLMSNLKHIHIQGIAEPFYQTREEGFLLFEVLDALDFDRHADHIMLSITTNGTLFKKSVREKYLKRAPCSSTTFSIDAASPETFRTIRIFDCFDLVIKNLYSFNEERKKGKQRLRINNNINTLNIHEVADMVGIGFKAGVDELEFNPTNGFLRSVLANERNCGSFAKAQRVIEEECRRLNIPVMFPQPLDFGLTQRLVQITLI